MKTFLTCLSSALLAAKTLEAVNASGEKVVLLARAGQDLSKYGVRYSHLGLAADRWPGWHHLARAALATRPSTGRAWASFSSMTCGGLRPHGWHRRPKSRRAC